MPKFKAPDHVTGIHTSVGTEFWADDNGIIEVPEDISAPELNSLHVAGWTRVAEAEPAVPASPPAKQPLAPKQPEPPTD